jgi:hypothetical protein
VDKISKSWQSWLIWLALLLTTGVGGYSAANIQIVGDGEGAKISVKAPETAKIGQLVVLDATESYVDSFKWEVTPKTDNFVVIEGGQRAFFSGDKPGSYTFWIAGALDKTVDLQSVTVTVEGVVPPDPGPTGMEAKIREWLKLVKSETWATEATAVATSFHGVSQQINGGVLRSPDDVIKATAISNRAVLGNSGPAWAGFGEELRKYLNSESAAGRLPDMPAHATLWAQIGSILEKIAHEGKR